MLKNLSMVVNWVYYFLFFLDSLYFTTDLLVLTTDLVCSTVGGSISFYNKLSFDFVSIKIYTKLLLTQHQNIRMLSWIYI